MDYKLYNLKITPQDEWSKDGHHCRCYDKYEFIPVPNTVKEALTAWKIYRDDLKAKLAEKRKRRPSTAQFLPAWVEPPKKKPKKDE